MNREKKIYLFMTVSSIFWAGAFIAGKVAVSEFPPFSVAFFRFLFATALIFPMMRRYEKNWRLKRSDWGPVLLLGLVGMFGYHVLFFKALQYTTAINSSMIGASNPLVTSILAAIFLGETLGRKRGAAIGIALLGVLLTVTGGDISVLTEMRLNPGDLLMLAAVLCWAAYSVISKKVMDRYSPLILTSYSFLVCLVLLFPFMLMENPAGFIGTISWKGWTSVLYMAVFPSVVGYLIQQISIKEIGASRTAAFINLVPVFSILLSTLILGETLTLIKLAGGAIIILGVYLNMRLKLAETEPPVQKPPASSPLR